MIKGYWFLFVVLLAYAHAANVDGSAFHRPLSEFRDCQPEWAGYAMFGVLLIFGVETVRNAFRADAPTDGLAFLCVTGLLLIVAITPSGGVLHNLCAVFSMLMMHLYLAVVLYYGNLFSLFAIHIVIPVGLLFVTKEQSYGIWQKEMILYFLSAIVIQHEFWTKPDRGYGLSTGTIQQSLQTRWIHKSKPEWLRELIEGIEWSRKSQPNPDTPFRPNSKRSVGRVKAGARPNDQSKRQAASTAKLAPLFREPVDRLSEDDDYHWLENSLSR